MGCLLLFVGCFFFCFIFCKVFLVMLVFVVYNRLLLSR